MSETPDFGLFEVLAADDSDERLASRKALAVCNKRVKDRFGAFLAAANDSDEYQARLGLIEADLKETVESVVSEYGGDPARIEASILQHIAYDAAEGLDDELAGQPSNDDIHSITDEPPQSINLEPDWAGMQAWLDNVAQTDPEVAQGIAEASGGKLQIPGAPDFQGMTERGNAWENEFGNPEPISDMNTRANVHTARRPKMCPYHREVTDISLASKDPVAGFNAMGQHAWGPQHCQSGEFEGRCNFKADMVTQEYWDNKAQQAEERKQQREEQRLQEQPLEQEMGLEEPVAEEPVMEESSEPGLNESLQDAPSAVGVGESMEPALASAREGFLAGPQMMPPHLFDQGANMAQQAEQLQEASGVLEQTGLLPIQQLQQAQGINQAQKAIEKGKVKLPGFLNPNKQMNPNDLLLASQREAEALKTVDVTEGGETPIPKMDKKKWDAPQLRGEGDGADLPGVEMEGSPHPTTRVDLLKPIPAQRSDDFLEGTKAVTEHQDVDQASSFDGAKADSGSWAKNNGGSPVTRDKQSTTDPDQNPIRQILESEYDGFVPQSQVQAAIERRKND